MPDKIPLFPLNTVLFPGGYLPLKIFEARYMDMVSECLRHESGFGVCLIRQGKEVGQAALTETVGTYARIMDFQQYPDGLLGITVKGQQRFRLHSTQIQPDNLLRGEVSWIDEQQPCPVPAGYEVLQELLLQLVEQDSNRGMEDYTSLDDAMQLGYRLAELLPIALPERQQLLEISDPLERLDRLLDWFNQADAESRSDTD